MDLRVVIMITFMLSLRLICIKSTETTTVRAKTTEPMKLVITSLEKCNEKIGNSFNPIKFDNLLISFTNINITYLGHTNAISFDMTIKETIPANFTLVFHVHKCLDINDLACSEFFMGIAGKVCSSLNETDSPWYKYLSHFSTPIVNCPLSAGTYYLRNVTLSLEDLNTFPLDKGYHVIKAYGYVGTEIVMCLYSEILVTNK